MSDVPVLVPEGKNATDLTVGELDIASRHLQADVLECITGDAPGRRWGAFIELAVLWAKRGGETNAKALQEKFRKYEIDELRHALRMDQEDEEEPDPTGLGDEPDESP